jgi:hypothetical protein
VTHPHRLRASLLICAALVAASTLTACSGGDGDGDGGSGGNGGGKGGGATTFGIAAGLAELPEQEDAPLLISVADVAAVSEANGLAAPASAADADVDWTGSVTGAVDSVAMLVPPGDGASLDQADYAEATGFSWVESDWFASVSAPPDEFAVYAGAPAEADLPSGATELEDGLLTLGEGDDYETNIEGDLSVDQLGRPLRLAQDRDLLATSLSTPMLESWADEGDTLADDDSLAAVAEALDGADVVSAVIQTLDESEVPTVGVGWAVVDGEPQVSVAYDLGSDDAAKDAVADIESAYTDGTSVATQQPYADLVPFADAEVVGRVVVVQVAAEPGRVMVPFSMLEQQDLPYLTTG